jgi:hypothetical protein
MLFLNGSQKRYLPSQFVQWGVSCPGLLWVKKITRNLSQYVWCPDHILSAPLEHFQPCYTLYTSHALQNKKNFALYIRTRPITAAARFKTWTVFARSNTGIVGSNPTRGIDVCVCLFCVGTVLFVGSGLATGWSPVQGVLGNAHGLRHTKSSQVPQGL